MPVVVRDGVRLFYSTAGAGRPIVLVHPLLMDGRCFGALVDRLARSLQVIVPDLRGCGESAAGDARFDLTTLAGDVVAVLDDARASKVVLCGVSLGAYVAMGVAAMVPERVVGLVVAAAGTGVLPAAEHERRSRMADAIETRGPDVIVDWGRRKFVPPTASDEVRQRLAAFIRVKSPEAVAQALRTANLRGNVAAALSAAGIPCLVLIGDSDRLVTVDEARAVASVVDGECRVMRGVGHLPHMEQPDTFSELVEAFVGRLAFS